MYREGKQFVPDVPMNFVLNNGALGDVITSLPAIIWARRHYAPELKMVVWGPSWQAPLLRCLLAAYGDIEIKNFEDFPMKAIERKDWDGGSVAINQMAFNTHTRNRVHMVDYAFGCLLDARPESMEERNYPTALLGPRAIPGPYVVFPVGATSANKLFRASVMVPVMRWCIEMGYRPVVVGTKTSFVKAESQGKLEPIIMMDEADKIPSGVMDLAKDLREQTTLLELRDILGYASAVVGVDGGTLHLAGTTNVPIIYALGTTLPKHRYITRRGNPSFRIRYVGPRNLECTGCQSNWRMSRQDFRLCAYGDNKCMELLDYKDFINGLKELGL